MARRTQKKTEKITPRALLELKMPGEVQIAPDSERIAYAVSETNWDENSVTQHLWLLKVGSDADPRQITRGRGNETEPRWSPDGLWLAFLSDRDDESDGAEDDEPKAQVWLLPTDGMGGEAERLTDAPEGVSAYDWLPDSSGVVYLAPEPRPKPLEEYREDKHERKDDAVVEREEKFRQQIWRIDREGKKPKLIYPGDFGLGEIAASPDGQSVAFTTNYTGEVNDYHKCDVWVVGMDGGDARAIAGGPGGKLHPVWTLDGSKVLYVAPLDPALSYSQPNLYAAAATGEKADPVCLTAGFPHDLTGWRGVRTDAAGNIYALAALGTTTAIFRYDGTVWESMVENDEHLHDYAVAPSGGLAYVSSSTVDAPELCWLAPGKKRPETLTDLNQDWADKYALAPTQLVTWKAPDGLEIEGLLTLPPGTPDGGGGQLPLIVNLHGGPHGRSVQALSPYTAWQTWAAAGYAVLSPNYRGSEGYGNAFSTANRGDLGGGDVSDILAGIDQAVAEKIADPDRLAVIGSSYGGYLVNWLIARTKRFRAAVSQFGIFSLTTDFSNSQAPRWETEYLGGFPWEQPALYADRSPSSYVTDIETPVLIMHGDQDPNTFIANSQEMYQALHLLGKPAEFVHYPREGHGLGEPEHRLDELRRCVSWFDKHLNHGANTVHRTGDKLVQNGWELTVTSATLETYAGRPDNGPRYVEIAFVLRDTAETRRPLTLKPADFRLTRTVPPSRPIRPAGLPVSVLGQKALAETASWSVPYVPGKDDRALAAPFALTFRLPSTGGTYQFTAFGFPPITLEVPAADKTDDEKKDEKKPGERK